MQVNETRDVNNLQIQLITVVMKLAKHGIPVAAIWFKDNEVKKYGSKFVKNILTNLDTEVVDNAIKEDMMNLVASEPDEPLFDLTNDDLPEKVRAKQVFRDLSCSQLPEELPLPLSCMNKKEKIIWLTKTIL